MSLKLYMDEHVDSAITDGLRRRSVDVITIQDEHREGSSDAEMLDRATELGRVLFSRDSDLLAEGVDRQRRGTFFCGVIYAHQWKVTVGNCISDLELLAGASDPEDLANQVLYLPLR
jgi:predicted nuclease of predicted toxin-antitoxin system